MPYAWTVAPSATRTRSFGTKQRQDCATLCAVLQGAVGPLPLQEQLEAAVAIATQVPQPPDLSEQQLTDCVSSGCDGGLPSKALSWA